MSQSKSTADLVSRLHVSNYPKKNNLTSTINQSSSEKGDGEGYLLKPKILSESQSLPTLKTNPSAPKLSKVEQLRSQFLPSHGGIGIKNLNISTSNTTTLLLNNHYDDYGAEEQDFTQTKITKKSIDSIDFMDGNSTEDTAGFNITKAAVDTISISRPKTFLDSLNLTPKQYYDLTNVPQTFFYLRIREETTTSKQSNGNEDPTIVPSTGTISI
jgi:hypothetical protein